jgi:N6-L-threonylcarbamoyladenine synthase
MLGREEPHFSFAGLKTAVRRCARQLAPLNEADIADLCAGFEAAVSESVADRCARAMSIGEERLPTKAPRRLVIAGGVAANKRLRWALSHLAAQRGYTLHVPPATLCTDNGAMIAWAGAERLVRGWTDALEAAARARWPLDELAAPVLGAGRLGAKA